MLHQLLAAVKPHLTVFVGKFLKLCWTINFYFLKFSMQIMHDVMSLGISTMCLVNLFLTGKILQQELQRKETKRKGTREKLTIMTSSTTRPSCIYSSSLLFPSTSSFFSSSSFMTFERLQALPPLLQGPVGQSLGYLFTRLASSSPPQPASPPPPPSWPVPILPKDRTKILA